VQDLLIGPSAVLSNSNIADGRIKWRDSVRGLRNSRNMQENRSKVVRI